ncbi:hypothetical protein D3C73_976800 [compost metagenome]
MQGGAPADGSYHLHAGTLAPGTVDIDNFIPLLHRQVDRLPGQLVQGTHGRYGGFADIQAALYQRPQFQQPHAQLVQAVVDALNVAAHDQVVKNAVRG